MCPSRSGPRPPARLLPLSLSIPFRPRSQPARFCPGAKTAAPR
uniref:Uncharacterized protein n=1 Tax=Human herpesvirus 1 TaxID=10298 RepID=A0A481U0R8_HHV1|nr:hypothetical protein [Human alphaherpesvirus 1]QBH87434.1 hypothetical protein [Human alphaherpesvirus 1]